MPAVGGAVDCVFWGLDITSRAVKPNPFCTLCLRIPQLQGRKFSKNRGAAVEVPYFLTKYDPDALRFYLTATLPETRDTEACPEGFEGFSWEDLVERNNPVLSAAEGPELVATHSLRSVQAWGNLCQRPRRALVCMLSFAYKRFDGKVPEPGDPSSSSGQGLDDEDRALLAQIEAGFETVGELYNACKFRAALNEALALVREANGYTFATLSAGLDRKAPWFQIKEDWLAATTSVYVILRMVDNLRPILAPILPLREPSPLFSEFDNQKPL